MSADATHTPCRNRGTVLQGPYCHVCGQHGHDPLRSFARAPEEVFESLWHLDGRVFRTLRDLLLPGRLAAAYLDGRRVRYLPPLRLFVILTVLTFFVGKLTLHVDPGTQTDAAVLEAGADGAENEFAGIAAATPAELAHARMRALIATRQASEADLARLEARIREEAGDDTGTGTGAGTDTAGTASSADDPQAEASSGPLRRWLVRRGLRLRENVAMIQREPDSFVRLFLGAVPGALFLLVPLFAPCLKLLYVRSGRGYLQHLTVALYSHCLMLLALLAVFALVGLQGLAGGMERGIEIFAGLTLGLGVPIYLLLMQKRLYGQGWGRTLVKYALLGATYTVLLGMAGLYAVVAGLST